MYNQRNKGEFFKSCLVEEIMKNKLLNFLSKYWLSILLSVIMVLGIPLSIKYSYLYQGPSEVVPFDLSSLYILLGLPIYALIYGCLSYVKARRIWVPQLILFIVAFLYWLTNGTNALFWAGTYIWSVYPVVFSLVASSVTKLIYYIVKEIKEDMK